MVLKVTLAVFWPPSVGTKVRFAGNPAAASELVNATVPEYPWTRLPAASVAVTVAVAAAPAQASGAANVTTSRVGPGTTVTCPVAAVTFTEDAVMVADAAPVGITLKTRRPLSVAVEGWGPGAAPVRITLKTRVPWSVAVKVKSPGRTALASVQANDTVPVNPSATLPKASTALTVNGSGPPEVTVSATPLMASATAAPAETGTLAIPCMPAEVSAATRTRAPAVLKVAETVFCPLSAGAKVTSAGNAACPSSLVKCTVPR